MKKNLLFFLFLLLVSYSHAQNNGAALYFTRPNGFKGIFVKMEVLVNGVSVTKMANNTTYVYTCSPNTGKVTIRAEACGLGKGSCSPDEITIPVQNGNLYFVRVEWGFYDLGGGKQIRVTQVSYDEVSSIFPNLESYVKNQNSHENSPQTATAQIVNSGGSGTQANNTVSSEVKDNGSAAKSNIVSDVDKDIPTHNEKKPYRFALIIGNEDYSSYQNGLSNEVNVAFATNDATIFKEYAIRTLGIPEDNAILILNARAIEMNRAISKMNMYAKNSGGKAQIYIYYAGHGFPDEKTKEPYLMPVDVSGSDLQFAVKLSDLYKKLTEYKTQNVTVFLDACFSGGARNQGLIAARGVKVKPKESVLNGSLVVFASSSGDQSSLSYKDKQHGMFTYFLLKKLKETNGQISYKELSDYLSEQVVLNSIRVNDKEQNPQINSSPEVQNDWGNWFFYK